MKILVITERTCSRTLKQIIALSKKNDVHLLTKRIPSGDYCKTVTYYDGTEDKLREALRMYNFVDIVYVHNEPGWTVYSVREILKNKRIVLDVHDAMIWRSNDEAHRSAEERLVFSWVDGMVVPSASCKEIINTNIPCVVLPPYCNEIVYQTRSWIRQGGIVYQGRVDLPDAPEFMDYCKYENLCKKFKESGIPFHMYMPGKDLSRHKELYNPICFFHKGLPYEQMISAMGFYDWGLCGNIPEHKEWNVAMPNKLFEYMAGGIPIIALNAKEVGDFVEANGVGISVRSIDEVKEFWDKRNECQKNVFLKRRNFTMENNIYVVENLFNQLV